jgi:hypothetical protein
MPGFEEDATKLHLIRCTLELLVPIAIADLAAFGGPNAWHQEQAAAFSRVLGAEGDTLLYYVKGKSGAMMGKFCEAVAVLAYAPGGVTLFGLHFEATANPGLSVATLSPYGGWFGD